MQVGDITDEEPVSTGTARRAEEDERLFVDLRGETVEAMIKAGKLLVDDERISSQNFKLEGPRDGWVQVVKLTHRNHAHLNDEQVCAALAKRGYQPPKSLRMLLAFGAKHPDQVKSNWIVCPGAKITDSEGNEFGVYLTMLCGSAWVRLYNLKLGWGPHCRFLVPADEPASAPKQAPAARKKSKKKAEETESEAERADDSDE